MRQRRMEFPLIIRPSFTLGGTGGSIAYNPEELEAAVKWGLQQSPVQQVLVEESVIGWKEFELEVMRDLADNVVIICSIENFDPMGVHTGDSITVAPAQTLTDKEYQLMRDAAIAIIREIGVETGGSNIQFAVNPADGRMVVIEMNPRVSRSSALASKATGFPIAKIAAKLAVGYTLDELRNDITRETPASFEPTIDYCVVKFPRWAFEKFPEADPTLTTQMKSVGEVMAIGRTFKEALQKAVRSLEQDRWGLTLDQPVADLEELRQKIRIPTPERCFAVAEGYRRGLSTAEIAGLTAIDPWFLENIREIVALRAASSRDAGTGDPDASGAPSSWASRTGASPSCCATTEAARARGAPRRGHRRHLQDGRHLRRRVRGAHAVPLLDVRGRGRGAGRPPRDKVVILGSGPNRIGQGIEFDYACVHAAFALREAGVEAIMVNCNPETVSTDYDTSDRLYFEPLTFEDVMNIVERERPRGVIVQFGGQTPLKLAVPLEKAGVPILGTPPDAIDRAEDRQRFAALLERSRAPAGARRHRPLLRGGRPHRRHHRLPRAGAPLLRARRAGHADRLRRGGPPALHDRGGAREPGASRSSSTSSSRTPSRSTWTPSPTASASWSAASWSTSRRRASTPATPPARCRPTRSATTRSSGSWAQTRALARELGVIGLLNIQFAIKNEQVFVLEVNPRASRTVPFVSKAIGVPLAKLATKVMLGRTLAELGFTEERAGQAHRRQGGGVPLHQVPRRRHRARPRDEVDRRGDGDRPRLPQGLRQVPARRRLAPAHVGQGVPLRQEPRQARACSRSPSASPTWASPWWRRRAPPSSSRGRA